MKDRFKTKIFLILIYCEKKVICDRILLNNILRLVIFDYKRNGDEIS